MEKSNKTKFYFILASFLIGLTTSGTMYVSAYLKLLGLSSAKVGLFTSLRSVIGIFAPLVWGVFCDKFKTIKKPFIVCLIFTIILFPLIPISENWLIGSAFAMAPWMTVFVRFFYRPLDSIMSSWTAQMRRINPDMEFGKIRIFNSLGSTLGGIIYTNLIGYFTIRVGFYGVGVFGLLVLLIAPKMQDAIPEGSRRLSFKDLQLGQLLKDKRIVCFYIFYICTGIPMCTSTNFIAYLLDDINAASSTLGILSTIRAFCGIPLLFYSGRVFRKFSPLSCALVTSIIFGIGDFIYFNAHSVTTVLIIAIVVYLASGLRNASLVMYADYLAPEKLRSTVLMLGGTMMAIATIISSTVGGYMIDSMGIRPYYIFSGGIALFGVIFFALFISSYNKKHPEIKEKD